jgi:hypothetical protein
MEKIKVIFAKLPFKGLAEKYIPAGAKAKVPFLEKIVIPFANYIVSGLVLLLLVIIVSSASASKGVALARQVHEINQRMQANAMLNLFNPNVGSMITNRTMDIAEELVPIYIKVRDLSPRELKRFEAELNRLDPPPPPPPPVQITNPTLTDDDISVSLAADGTANILRYTGSDKNLGHVTIPATVQGVKVTIFGGAGSFFGDVSSTVTGITLPEGITVIGERAFSGCNRLASVTLPSTLVNLGRYAFSGCSALTSISLPVGLKEIGTNVFQRSGLTSFPNPWPAAIAYIPEGAFRETNLGDLVIPEGITHIYEAAFADASLTSLTLPSTINRIMRRAFSNTGLTNITFHSDFNGIINQTAFERNNLNLASQAALRQAGSRGN